MIAKMLPNLFNIVASFSTCFNEHYIQFPSFSFSLFSGDLLMMDTINDYLHCIKFCSQIYLSFIRKICFISY